MCVTMIVSEIEVGNNSRGVIEAVGDRNVFVWNPLVEKDIFLKLLRFNGK